LVANPRESDPLTQDFESVQNMLAGIKREEGGDLAGAIAVYMDVVRSDPQNTIAWNQLGNVYKKQGNLDAAIKALARAVMGEPDDDDSDGFFDGLNLGKLLLIQGGEGEALYCGQKAQALGIRQKKGKESTRIMTPLILEDLKTFMKRLQKRKTKTIPPLVIMQD
jgi:tetratricopeptide (TPR) repeat protein